MAGDSEFRDLGRRLGPALLRQRLHRQANLVARLVHQGEGALFIERVVPVDRIVEMFLTVAGLRERGIANCLDIQVVERDQPLAALPREFDGFRLLHVSDPHLDLIPGFTDRLIGLIRETPHDLAVVTGDFADHPAGYFHDFLDDLRRLAAALGPGALAILGNHDTIEVVPHLERSGLRVLLNENAFVERGGARLWIAGVDDPYFYRTHDLAAARRGIPADACAVLLSHSPETWAEAERLGYSFMLSGHTHAGQICLPGGIAIVRHGRCPNAMFAGAWSHGGLRGYTSRGTGSCGVAARFNCPPELTVHVLRSI